MTSLTRTPSIHSGEATYVMHDTRHLYDGRTTHARTRTPTPTASATTRRAGMVLLLDGGVGHEWKKAHGAASFLGGALACETDPARTGVPPSCGALVA